MKRLLITFSILLIAICSFSQTVRLNQALSEYYKVYTDVSDEFAVEISEKMEAALVLFNEIFHFDLSTLETKFKVTIYQDKSGFDRYLQRLLGQTRDDFVYIHYTDLRKSELVGFKKEDDAELNSSLLHQGLIQFVKTYVPNIPLWMSEGAAAYIENSTYVSGSASGNTETEIDEYSEDEEFEEDADEEEFEEDIVEETASNTTKNYFILNKSLVWLDSLKSLLKGETGNSPLSIEKLLTIDKETVTTLIDIFYPEAWGFVFFLLNTPNKAYNRLFWDSINILDPAKSLSENSKTVLNLFTKWKDKNTLYTDFKSYILSLKTFNDYIKTALDFYNSGKYKDAEDNFKIAADLKPSHYFPQYYLGLIYYTNKEYYNAEEYYLNALANGADKGLTYYALGVNAYADNNYDTAKEYLTSASNVDPDNYQEKVDFLLNRIESEKIDEDLYMDYDIDTEIDLDTDIDTDLETEYDEFTEDEEFEEENGK